MAKFMSRFVMPLVVLLLTACTTAGQLKPEEMLGKACPIVRGVILTVGVTEGITDKTKDALKDIEPLVDTACSAPPDASAAGVNILVVSAIPLIQKAVSDSDLEDDKKQSILISLVVAQVVMAGVQ